MNSFRLINIEWNCYNGFIFDILHLETYKLLNLDSALFGVSFSKRFLYVDVLFFTIKIFDKTGLN